MLILTRKMHSMYICSLTVNNIIKWHDPAPIKKKTVDGNERGKKKHPIKRIGFLEMFTYKETGLFLFFLFYFIF